MKKSIRIKFVISYILLVFIFCGCGKYKDGPDMSLRSKKSRLMGDWKSNEYIVDDTLYSPSIYMVLGIKDQEKFTMTIYFNNVDPEYRIVNVGSWYFSEDKSKVELSTENSSIIVADNSLTGPNQGTVFYFTIKRLTKNELWATSVDGYGHLGEFKFEKRE